MGTVKKNVITEVPKLGRWMEYDGFSMPYSFPAMIALAECWLRSLEDGTPLSYTTTYQIYKKLLHFTGMAYGFLWNDGDEMIGELWRINHFDDMVQRAMAGLGRDYIWMNIKDCSCEKMKQKIVQTIDNKMPVVMEFAGMLPEFNLVAGYDDYGDTLIGWTYCEELVEEREDNEMFRKFAEWSNPASKEYNKYKTLILGERVPVTLTDHQAIEYALETMERTESQDHGYMSFLAGRSAFEKSVAYLASEKRMGLSLYLIFIWTLILYRRRNVCCLIMYHLWINIPAVKTYVLLWMYYALALGIWKQHVINCFQKSRSIEKHRLNVQIVF